METPRQLTTTEIGKLIDLTLKGKNIIKNSTRGCFVVALLANRVCMWFQPGRHPTHHTPSSGSARPCSRRLVNGSPVGHVVPKIGETASRFCVATKDGVTDRTSLYACLQVVT
ncbi:hypothetical protein BC936DRAFT_140341 [Jimgerdemannia flammicorona]|uniref:Uncharacterized protein n=1 Tax=Jimgerdemannia flammicorona TaxID=994334 RepID=A0A433AUH8_9FUNG|nr:hypothetical protein BC936DRAFT_140341 [Jimgerdemannia flammicorona]